MTRLFRFLEPTFFAGLIDDPCLVVRDRPIHKSILLDCGALHHVAKREMKPVQAIFVSHAHMDHFMGFDTFLRQVIANPRTVELFGPPGMAERVAGRLAGYDWNLAEPYWCTLLVHEVHPEQILSVRFAGPEGFRRHELGAAPRTEAVIYRHNHLEVAAEILDHGIPVLAFRVWERKIFALDGATLTALGLLPGVWMEELKRRFFEDWPEAPPLRIMRMGTEGPREETVADAAAFYGQIRAVPQSPSLGYLTDWGWSPENLEKVRRFMTGVDLLIGECAFLRAEASRARTSRHLCTADWNRLLAELRPRAFLPMHLSKTYLRRSAELYAELAPPPETEILTLPEHLAPRPLHAQEACVLRRLTRQTS
ncbi:ribonuclease Z [Trichloromonas sp.]|uniref:ribonuclease Z n=1 Tax=Trichloromonas sp. TaxID=3069249 RepID=UPI002A3A2783|nr:MBL fold metallo-hydrolase [Trichloromonas sp.]